MIRPTVLRASMLMAAVSALAGTARAQRIDMPVGYRLTWIGARWQAGARVLDPRTRQPVPATITYRIADPAVASVSPRGEVTARKAGTTRLWAVAGRDSAFALIQVQPLPARFTFSPSVIRFDAFGARQAVRVLASDSAGVAIEDGAARAGACRIVNDRVATLARDSVVSVGNGSTWLRCSDRGIADSVRVEVQQRTVAAVITNKPQFTRQRAPGDTFSVRVTARDRMSSAVADARATFASLDPYVVSIDPVTGRGRAVGGGDTRVIVQVGNVADSVSISVSGAPAPRQTTTVVAVDTTQKSKLSLVASEMFIYEGDTVPVQITATDSSGASVGLSSLSFLIRDTSVVGKLDTTRIIGRKEAQTYVVVRYAGKVDSAPINVRQRLAISATGAGAGGDAAANFVPPAIRDSTPQHAALSDTIRKIIFTDPSLGVIRQNLVLFANATGAFAEHAARTETGALEDRSGPLVGAMGTVVFFQRLELAGSYRQGTLVSADSLGEQLTVKEAEVSAGFFPVRQVGLRAGAILRGEQTALATQTWQIPKVSLVTRMSFIGDVFNTFAVVSVLPKAVSQRAGGVTETGSLFSRGGEAGIEFRLARRTALNGALTYAIEQVSFDDSERTETFSAIRLRFGFNIGK
jgi:hypothetical protein